MKKSLYLLAVIVVFMYAAFAANHYFYGLWFKAPTVLLMSCIAIAHAIVFYFNLPKEKK